MIKFTYEVYSRLTLEQSDLILHREPTCDVASWRHIFLVIRQELAHFENLKEFN